MSFVTHMKRMKDEVALKSKVPEELDRYIPLSFSAVSEEQTTFGGVSGWISYDFAILESIWVFHEKQGEGLGRGLFEKFEKEAIAHSCSRILTSTNSFSHSLGFWQKNGFELIHTVHSGNNLMVYYLEKKLIS